MFCGVLEEEMDEDKLVFAPAAPPATPPTSQLKHKNISEGVSPQQPNPVAAWPPQCQTPLSA